MLVGYLEWGSRLAVMNSRQNTAAAEGGLRVPDNEIPPHLSLPPFDTRPLCLGRTTEGRWNKRHGARRKERTMKDFMRNEPAAPAVVDRGTFQAELDALRVREKAHTRQGDAIAATRRRLPMVEMDSAIPLIGAGGTVTLLDAFEGRRLLIAYYFMWHTGHPAAEQCEGCTLYTSQVRELSFIHSRDATYATFCQGPYEESARYRDFMGWEMPWYSAQDSLGTLLVGRRVGVMHIVCYLRQGSKVFETYWTTRRGVEVMGNSYGLLDLTVYGRQERSEELAGRLATTAERRAQLP